MSLDGIEQADGLSVRQGNDDVGAGRDVLEHGFGLRRPDHRRTLRGDQALLRLVERGDLRDAVVSGHATADPIKEGDDR